MILLSGILLLALPFLLVFLFDDRVKGFSYVLVSGTMFHLAVSLTTQFFGVFSYPVVALTHLTVLCAIIIAVLVGKRKSLKLRLDPYVVLAILVIFFQFWSVHYDYTGKIHGLNGQAEVQNNSYSYPMYSDEWIAAGLSEYTIRSSSLPLVNPLRDDRPFSNLLMMFHSILAEFFLLTGFSPVTDFAVASILGGLMVCMASLILLCSLSLNIRTSILAVLLLPYITQAGYLPGLWHILPYTLGLIFLLIFLAGLARKDAKLAVASSILALLFYPPIIVFWAPACALYFKKEIRSTAILFGLCCLPVIFSETIASKVFRINYDGGILQYPMWHIVPLAVFPLALIGIHQLYKKGSVFLAAPVVVGLAYWIFYDFYPHVIIIEKGRIVIITSVLLVVLAGVGLNRYSGFFARRPVMGSLMCMFGVLSLVYPIGDKWMHVSISAFDERVTAPVSSPSPILHYLIQEDLDLFSGIHGQTFIAPPWKGLVLGVATDNEPLETKPSTITTTILPYKNFMNASCDKKSEYAKKYSVDIVYSAFFACDGFDLVGQSPEGLKLYRVEKTN